MKTLNILKYMGFFALFLASFFNLINQITEKSIFGISITVSLYAIGVVGTFCGFLLHCKNKHK